MINYTYNWICDLHAHIESWDGHFEVFGFWILYFQKSGFGFPGIYSKDLKILALDPNLDLDNLSRKYMICLVNLQLCSKFAEIWDQRHVWEILGFQQFWTRDWVSWIFQKNPNPRKNPERSKFKTKKDLNPR